ncbi:MAG: hypothetical protein KAX19_09410, partial [Candidatus Brocadiae bacterium]|nr:hypothetical protein [Candidatus Brocadiia bacterium]
GEIHNYLGMDSLYILPFGPQMLKCPPAVSYGAPRVTDLKEYEAILPLEIPRANLERFRGDGRAVCWFETIGPFMHTRDLLGIENQLLAFYDKPELVKRMIQDLTDAYVQELSRIGEDFKPDYMTFSEDMSYNHGPMISQDIFEGFLGPFYERIVPLLKKRNIISMVDSDGFVEPMVPWFESLGIDGILPMERQAGCDVNRIRANHPRCHMLGGFDKMVLHRGETAIRAEFQRLRPAVLSGRFIPSVDHQTPPAVSLQDYRLYVRLFKEFSEEVAAERNG